MKLKTILFTFFISLLALGLLGAFSAPATAQKTTDVNKSSVKLITGKAAGAKDESGEKAEAKTGQASSQSKPTAEKKVAAAPKDAGYWFDKGALCATYGNDRAAVKYFQKAISLDPNRSGAYFEQGVSYGQLGEYDKAIALINKALAMQPQNGLYLYGRARVYLLAGEKEKAMQDFKKAAELDDEDAQNYLEHIAKF